MLSGIKSLRSIPISLRFTGQYTALMMVIAVAVVTGLIVAQGSLLYILALAAIPFVFRWPVETTLGSFVFLIPFDAIALIGNGRTLTWFVGAASVLILMSMGLASGRLHSPPRAALWWLLFVVWSAMTLFWALDPEVSFPRLPTAAALIALYLVVTSFDVTAKELRSVFFFAIVGGVMASLYASVTFYQGANIAGTMRASLIAGGREADPNIFSACLLLPISLAFASIVYSRRRSSKVLASLALGVLLLALLLAMSRGTMVALGVLIFVYVRRVQLIRRILAPIAIVLLLLAFVPTTFFSRFKEAVPTGGAGRVSIWTAGLVSLKDYWLIGAGVDNFPVAYRSNAGSAPVFKGYSLGSHNIYLGMSVEEGILGIILFCAASASQLLDARKGENQNIHAPQLAIVPYEAACWAMLTVGLFLDNLWDKEFWTCWILLAIAVQIRNKGSVEPASAGKVLVANRYYRNRSVG